MAASAATGRRSTNFFGVLLTSITDCDDQPMDAEIVVAPLRKAVQGLLTHAPLTEADRNALTKIDTNAAQLGTGYGDISDPAAANALNKEMDGLYRQAHSIAARYAGR